MRKYYYDVDGVVRDLVSTVGLQDCDSWECMKQKHFVYIKQNPIDCIVNAPPHQDVVDFINRRETKPHFLTGNRSAEKYNRLFLDRFFDDYDLTFSNGMEDKLSYLGENDRLFDDYPFFSDTSKIILVPRKWNFKTMKNYRRFLWL